MDAHQALIESFKDLYCSPAFWNDLKKPEGDLYNLNSFISETQQALRDKDVADCEVVIVAVVCFLFGYEDKFDLRVFADKLLDRKGIDENQRTNVLETLFMIREAMMMAFREQKLFDPVSPAKLNPTTEITTENLQPWGKKDIAFYKSGGHVGASIAALLSPYDTVDGFKNDAKVQGAVIEAFAIYLEQITGERVPATPESLLRAFQKKLQLKKPEPISKAISTNPFKGVKSTVPFGVAQTNTPPDSTNQSENGLYNQDVNTDQDMGMAEKEERVEKVVDGDLENMSFQGTFACGAGLRRLFIPNEKNYNKRGHCCPLSYTNSSRDIPRKETDPDFKSIKGLNGSYDHYRWYARTEFTTKTLYSGSLFGRTPDGKQIRIAASRLPDDWLKQAEKEVAVLIAS
ncbi:MAG: hypothetical protein Q9188_001932 [Gyalolechia gomerana]